MESIEQWETSYTPNVASTTAASPACNNMGIDIRQLTQPKRNEPGRAANEYT
jgi:hypothetical protein